jgi:hypothetical protein
MRFVHRRISGYHGQIAENHMILLSCQTIHAIVGRISQIRCQSESRKVRFPSGGYGERSCDNLVAEGIIFFSRLIERIIRALPAILNAEIRELRKHE